MKHFEVGHRYEANDPSLGYIKVTGRTEKFIKVINQHGNEWRMKIREDGSSEYVYESSVGREWEEAFTYKATWEI